MSLISFSCHYITYITLYHMSILRNGHVALSNLGVEGHHTVNLPLCTYSVMALIRQSAFHNISTYLYIYIYIYRYIDIDI